MRNIAEINVLSQRLISMTHQSLPCFVAISVYAGLLGGLVKVSIFAVRFRTCIYFDWKGEPRLILDTPKEAGNYILKFSGDLQLYSKRLRLRA